MVLVGNKLVLKLNHWLFRNFDCPILIKKQHYDYVGLRFRNIDQHDRKMQKTFDIYKANELILVKPCLKNKFEPYLEICVENILKYKKVRSLRNITIYELMKLVYDEFGFYKKDPKELKDVDIKFRVALIYIEPVIVFATLNLPIYYNNTIDVIEVSRVISFDVVSLVCFEQDQFLKDVCRTINADCSEYLASFSDFIYIIPISEIQYILKNLFDDVITVFSKTLNVKEVEIINIDYDKNVDLLSLLYENVKNIYDNLGGLYL